MKASLKYIISAALAATLSFPAMAQDEPVEDTPRFSTDDFLEEWSIFLKEEDGNSVDDEGPVSLDGPDKKKKEKKDGFVYFNTESLSAVATKPLTLKNQNETILPFTPRKTSLSNTLENISLPGESWLVDTFTPRYAGIEVSLSSTSSDPEEKPKSKFDFSLSSQVSSRQTNIFGAVNNDYVLEALNRQVYDVGLNVDYRGFGLGASIRGEESAFFDGIAGYDVGISYSRSTWSTSLMVGEYRQGSNLLLGLNNDLYNERFFAIEFGAAYKLAPWFQFVGSFRYYEDANLILLDPSGVSTTQMFYLGTKLNF